MFQKILALAFGMALGVGDAQAASPVAVLPGGPAIGAELTPIGHRHPLGHDRRGYHRGYDDLHPRHRNWRYNQPRNGYNRGYHRDNRGRYPAHGRDNAYPRGHGYGAWQNYLRDRYGK